MDDQSTRGTGAGQNAGEEKRERQAGGGAGEAINRTRDLAADALERTKAAARNVGEQARNMGEQARNVGEQARKTGEQVRSAIARGDTEELQRQASAAGEVISEQSARAGEYLTQRVNEYPLTALLVAGAIGYGLAYLIHGGSQSD
ncbi:MAG TPA: hypothetical protein VME41_11110 [Stellaceae bacterium]|nr:hypothetical protein [Stellaceae bacterium]